MRRGEHVRNVDFNLVAPTTTADISYISEIPGTTYR